MENRNGTRVFRTQRTVQRGPVFRFLVSTLATRVTKGARSTALPFRESRVTFYVSRFPLIFYFPFLFFLFLSGCGAPGEPVPPSPPVAVAVADLTVQQKGDGVELVFTLPAKTISGDRLTATPAIEIARGIVKADGTADSKSFRLVYTIPGALVGNYVVGGHVHFTDPIAPAETKAHPGGGVAYTIRTRVSAKRASGNSNVVIARVFPVPQPIASVQVQVRENAVNLSWTAPTLTSAGAPLPTLSGYRVYRRESDSRTTAPASKDVAEAPRTSPPVLLGPTATNSFSDTQFDFGKTYVYLVRSVITEEGQEIESDDSEPATITVVDTFPPAAPQGLVAAVLPGETPSTFVVDLSWSINVETDLAGYHVYRSEQEGTKGQLVTSDLLPTPAVRDKSVEPGHRYWYVVTALDRAGNESAPSAAVAVEIAQPPS
jgi:hypothetical protein